MLEFGERIQVKPVQRQGQKKNDLAGRLVVGRFVGIHMRSAEILIMTQTGIVRGKSFYRMAPHERWDPEGWYDFHCIADSLPKASGSQGAPGCGWARAHLPPVGGVWVAPFPHPHVGEAGTGAPVDRRDRVVAGTRCSCIYVHIHLCIYIYW